jgi:tetratricopeptide (TPR) repeat protein
LKKRSRFKSVPFLLLSSENLDDDVVLASEGGIDGYLLKPFSFEEFKESLSKVLRAALQPNKANELLGEAAKLIEEEKLKRAGQILKTVLNTRPNSARAFMLLAKISLAKEDIATATQLLNEGIECNAKFLGSYLLLLDLYRQSEDWTNFLEIAKKLNVQSPQNPKYCLILAEGFLNTGETTESETYYKKSIRLSPKMAAAHKGLGMVYMKREEFELAMRQFKKALDLDGRDVGLINSLGLAYVRMGKISEAIAKYQTALQIEPGDHRVLFNLGHAYERMGDLKKAALFYRQCLDRDPSFDKARQRLEGLMSAAS